MSTHTPATKASVYQDGPLNPNFVAIVRKVETALQMRVFCILHQRGADDHKDTISPWLASQMLKQLSRIQRDKPIALLLHSPGGDANSAFRLARMLNRHCGEYSVIVPRWAKSAATLLSLGASDLYLGEHAELGPIDVQLDDPDHERQMSALEMVQSLERLNSEAMQAADSMMSLLLNRSGKRIDSLLPAVLKYAADVMRPIFEKVDTVAFTYHARLLKIGEDYAEMLLRDRYEGRAKSLAIQLARGYPDHGFVIDGDEATRIGLEVKSLPDDLREPLGPSLFSYTKSTVLGFLEDAPNATEATQTTSEPASAVDASSGNGPNEQQNRNGPERRAGDRSGEDRPAEPVDAVE